MVDAYSVRRIDQRRMVDADQAEFAAVMHGSAVVDAGVYDERVASAMDDFEPTGVQLGADWQRQDLRAEMAVGGVHEEVLRRSDAMGASYPFVITDNKVTYTTSTTGFYEFCLAISLAPNLSKGKYADLPKTFERIVTILVTAYFGIHAEGVHTGKPREHSVGTKFKDAMVHLNKLSGEWIWAPWKDLPGDPETTGDEGVDFVVWKKTLDKRHGNLFILGQCACGDDWDSKLKDVDLDRIQKWFHPLSYVAPVRAFATPHHVSTSWVTHVLASAGLLFDRARLTAIAETAGGARDLKGWKDSMKSLSEFVVTTSKGDPGVTGVAA